MVGSGRSFCAEVLKICSEGDRGLGSRRLSLEAAGIYLDYSKNRVTDDTLRLLLQLAETAGLRERIDVMFRGEKINVTENCAVLHVALRTPNSSVEPCKAIFVDGQNVVPEVHAVLDKMAAFANRVRSGQWKVSTNAPFVCQPGRRTLLIFPSYLMTVLMTFRPLPHGRGSDAFVSFGACDHRERLLAELVIS